MSAALRALPLPLLGLGLAFGLSSPSACDAARPRAAEPPLVAQAPAVPEPASAPSPASAAPAATPLLLAPAAGAAIEDERNSIEVFRAASPATVFVTQTRIVADMFSLRTAEVPAGSGTGFIWDERGHVVTNFHVIAGEDRRAPAGIQVTLHDRKTYDAEIVGIDPAHDIAVLKLPAAAAGLVAIRQPPPDQEVQVGQKTLAIGNPFGLDHTLTTGVVSALGREVVGIGNRTIRDMIQTDAAINPGNSGGPLLDSRGQLMGMNTMIFSKSGSSAGIGFAVPVKTIRRVVPQLIERGRPLLVGIGFEPVPDDLARRLGISGVIVDQVVPSSPAARAGLQSVSRSRDGQIHFDVIVGIDGKKIRHGDDLFQAMDGRRPGEKVTVQVWHDGKVRELAVTLIELPR
jgi:S1-C subfamily serine protease